MGIRFDRKHKDPAVILGVVTLAGVVLLLVQDTAPKVLPSINHSFLAAFSLALIACAYMVFQLANRATLMELAKTALLAAAFLFWAANQLLPNGRESGLYNDIAIALFVLDVFWVISSRTPASKESFPGEVGRCQPGRCETGCDCACCSRQAS